MVFITPIHVSQFDTQLSIVCIYILVEEEVGFFNIPLPFLTPCSITNYTFSRLFDCTPLSWLLSHPSHYFDYFRQLNGRSLPLAVPGQWFDDELHVLWVLTFPVLPLVR